MAGMGMPIADWITGAATSIMGIAQTVKGTREYRKGVAELNQVPLQDTQSQNYLDTVRRKRIGVETGTGTKFSALQNMIDNSISEGLKGIASVGGSSGSTLAGMGYANMNAGRMMNTLLSGMDDSNQLLGMEYGINKDLVNRELQLRLLRSAVKTGHGSDMQKAGLQNIVGGAAMAAGADYTPTNNPIQSQPQMEVETSSSNSDVTFDLEGAARRRSYGGMMGSII